MKKILRVKQSFNAPFNLTWIINNICPNSCIYCPSNLHNGTNHNYDWDHAKLFMTELLQRHPNIHCSIAGGEPTMSPFLPQLVKLIHDNNGFITMTTNGYKTPNYWTEVAPNIDWIGFSYHPEFSTERYFENLSTAAMLTQCGARIMMLSTHWDQCVEVYERLKTNPYHTTTAVRINNWLGKDNNGSDHYTDEQLTWFANNRDDESMLTRHGHLPVRETFNSAIRLHMDDGEVVRPRILVEYINNKQTNFKGYTCEIGLKSLFISETGNIKRGNCLEGGSIGHISDPMNIQWPTAPVTCSYDLCHCTTDVQINKWIN